MINEKINDVDDAANENNDVTSSFMNLYETVGVYKVDGSTEVTVNIALKIALAKDLSEIYEHFKIPTCLTEVITPLIRMITQAFG